MIVYEFYQGDKNLWSMIQKFSGGELTYAVAILSESVPERNVYNVHVLRWVSPFGNERERIGEGSFRRSCFLVASAEEGDSALGQSIAQSWMNRT